MQVQLSNQSRRDLAQHWSYIARDSAANASRWRARILDRCRQLAVHPKIGEACSHLRPALRRTSLGNYVIYYEPRDSEIRIVRVLHGAQDETAQF